MDNLRFQLTRKKTPVDSNNAFCLGPDELFRAKHWHCHRLSYSNPLLKDNISMVFPSDLLEFLSLSEDEYCQDERPSLSFFAFNRGPCTPSTRATLLLMMVTIFG